MMLSERGPIRLGPMAPLSVLSCISERAPSINVLMELHHGVLEQVRLFVSNVTGAGFKFTAGSKCPLLL